MCFVNFPFSASAFGLFIRGLWMECIEWDRYTGCIHVNIFTLRLSFNCLQCWEIWKLWHEMYVCLCFVSVSVFNCIISVQNVVQFLCTSYALSHFDHKTQCQKKMWIYWAQMIFFPFLELFFEDERRKRKHNLWFCRSNSNSLGLLIEVKY